MRPAQNDLDWHHSSFCNGGDCIEVASQGKHVMIKDSGDPSGTCLAFSQAAWRRFMIDVKADRLAGVS